MNVSAAGMGKGIGFAVLGIAVLALVATIWHFYRKVKRFAQENFGTDDLSRIAAMAEEEEANTPKSVSGMTSLYLPQLQKDFPELNWVEFQELAKSHIKRHLEEMGRTNVRFHQTVLRDYRKASGTCYVVLQSSVESMQEEKKIQSRFNVTMAYVQDAEKTGNASAYSINCPNCGAAVSALGNKVCEYCGSIIREVNMHIWELEKVEEA